MASPQRRSAFTLAELVLSVVLGTMILFAMYRVLSTSMKTSVKGSAHLTNVQASAIFIRQVVKDVRRAGDVSRMAPDQDEPSASFDILEECETGGLATSTVIYEVGPGGLGVIRRVVPGPGTGLPEETHTFCRNLQITHCRFRSCHLVPEGIGFFVSLKTATPPNGTEEFELKRFILCQNHASNTRLIKW
jgi:hypothetical protein